MIAIILSLNRRKESSLEDVLFHLSPIAMRLSRYAGATPGTGCCGESSVAGHLPDGLLPSIRVKVCLSRRFISLERR